jgi:hypothetical protein
MSRLIGVALTVILLLIPTTLTRQQFAKFNAIEAYEIRPRILMMPTYSADGYVCEIGLEKLHYSPETIRLDSGLSRMEIDEIFDELVPVEQRGERLKGVSGNLITISGQGLTTNIDFENVSIQIYGQILSAARKGGTTVDEVAAALRWKNRNCK